jgi:Zn-dependent protease with chaperone function
MPLEPVDHESTVLAANPHSATDGAEKGTGTGPARGAARKARSVRVRPGVVAEQGPNARGVAEAVGATVRTLTAEQIVRAFGAAIEPVRPSRLYRVSVVVVAIVMVLLPLIYVGMIGLIVAGLYYHAVHHISIFQNVGNGRGNTKAALAIYVTPLVAGAMVVAFMLKPLFARSARREQAHVLEPETEPLLHDFVARICDAVGARHPCRIEADCEINASARREGMFLGLFGNKLVLRIGLPLVAGLDLKQFAGVLAHEFGHFSQGAGMRLAALIMSINAWFARVVYERDSWDESLAQWSGSGNHDIYLMILVGVIRFSVWLTRRILWVLMWLGHLVSVSLRRQMEYDADRYEARMVGGAVFAETMSQFRLMGLASNGAHVDLRSSWQEHRLPENFPKLVVANIPQIAQEAVAASSESVDKGTTGWLDLYPCDKDRMAHAAVEEPGTGVFHLEGPATDVFSNFDSLARDVSFGLYKSWLGTEISEDQLFSVADLVETQAGAQEGYEALQRYFLGAFGFLTDRLRLPAAYPVASIDPAAAQQAISRARNDMHGARAAHVKAIEQTDLTLARLWQTESAIAAISVGMPIKAAEFGLDGANLDAAERARGQAEDELRRIFSECEPFGALGAQRLFEALALLEEDSVADTIPDGRDRRLEARGVYPCVAYLGSHYADLVSPLIVRRSVLIGMTNAYQAAKDPKPQSTINGLLRAAETTRGALEGVQSKVSDSIAYPFQHAQEEITLRRFALSRELPDKTDIGGVLQMSDEVVNRLHGLYLRALGRLAVTAEEVERALGLPPIESSIAETHSP